VAMFTFLASIAEFTGYNLKDFIEEKQKNIHSDSLPNPSGNNLPSLDFHKDSCKSVN